jgi:NADP-dependent 3-hydroxy acid dehydrogenase YdfG
VAIEGKVVAITAATSGSGETTAKPACRSAKVVLGARARSGCGQWRLRYAKLHSKPSLSNTEHSDGKRQAFAFLIVTCSGQGGPIDIPEKIANR